jgi:DNA-binding Lrp family transcriptional regulator
MLKSKISSLDLKILNEMVKGKRLGEVAQETGITEKTVRNHIQALEDKGVIVRGRENIPLIDIFKVWNHVFVTNIKLHLPSAIPVAGRAESPFATPTPAPPAWFDAIKKLKEIPLFNKLVRYAFAMFGTEYDLMLIITSQSFDEYADFSNELQKRTGLIEKVWGTRVIEVATYHYDPISVPDPKEEEESLRHTRESIDEALGS